MDADAIAAEFPSLAPVRAGRLSAVFDISTGFLRHIQWDGREALRAIYGAVRDRDWGTLEPAMSELRIDELPDAFHISFTAEFACSKQDIRHTSRCAIDGSADGALTYHFEGEAHSNFLKNRIGLCVLHPAPGVEGRRCAVEHTDGSRTETLFPVAISPHQPFENVRAIEHELDHELRIRVVFDGEVFETEDQRNWTDASFKTYGTPLALPFPVKIRPGDTVDQTVTVHIKEPGGKARGGAAPSIPNLSVDWSSPAPRPPVGFTIDVTRIPVSDAIENTLRRLAPDHLRVDIEPSQTNWQADLAATDKLAAAIDTSLHLSLHLDPPSAMEQLDLIARQLILPDSRVSLVIVYSKNHPATPPELAALARDKLPGHIPIATGSNANFAELNRHRPEAGSATLPCFSINPQVHAFDDLSLVESLAAQPATLATSRTFSTQPVVISPITLLPRFNPVATSNEAGTEPKADPRQSGDFAAAWTLGSLAVLLPSAQLHSLSYFETHGPRGVMDENGSAFPVAEVFAALVGTTQTFPATCTEPLAAAALALASPDGSRKKLLVANFLPHTQSVIADSHRITLAPHSITTIER